MRRRQLTDEVAAYLRQSIIAGELPPGESVRAEAIGEALDVSATPVREALHALRVEGFLDLVPRRGFTVAHLVADDIRDVFEAHALIAGELTARAAVRADDAELDELRDVHERLVAVADDDDPVVTERLIHEFHRDLYLLAGSERLRWALGTFAKYVPSAFHAQIDGWARITLTDHAAIVDALRSRDVEAARAAMQAHIRSSGELLAERFELRRHAG
ncbi:GntR family transcriptional regulator [Microbacterium sp. No. 7]|uniref:GntR family transcriptional regulator n=1 Tax=Microbacterium sp. No. 7 TaxID=1714373 RepID=UPI0006D22C50|nr:GntR family transcriptional regulator [Microbacterium sp. No. 7]ALJ19257.1 hypothetical protein AOA12_04805 [Microbacterium sp. No. 7]